MLRKRCVPSIGTPRGPLRLRGDCILFTLDTDPARSADPNNGARRRRTSITPQGGDDDAVAAFGLRAVVSMVCAIAIPVSFVAANACDGRNFVSFAPDLAVCERTRPSS